MAIDTGPMCDVDILNGYPTRLFDASMSRFLLRNSRTERCMLLLHVHPPGGSKKKRINWGMEREMYSTRQIVTKHQGVDSLLFLLSFQADTGHSIDPLGEDLSQTVQDWHPEFSDVRMLALHDLVQQRKDIFFLDTLDRHPSSELIIGSCAVGTSPSEGCLARFNVLGSSYGLHISFGLPPYATGQNLQGRFALQLELREDQSCLIM
jgi:hypothetical protein